MSKSDPSDQSRINLADDADTIALKIRRAKTDPQPLPDEPAGLKGRPEARNLVGIYAAMADTDAAGVLREHGGRGFGAFKEALAALLISHLAPIAAETRRLLADPGAIRASRIPPSTLLGRSQAEAAALALAVEEIWWSQSAESPDSVIARANRFRAETAAHPEWQNLLVVSHWGFILSLTGQSLANGDWLRYDPREPPPLEIRWQA